MANWTMDVLGILRGLVNEPESVDLDGLVDKTWDIVFHPFPIFDESYRKTLCVKILRHYMFQEIGYETVAQWMFALNRRMCEVMPLFNEVYKEKLKVLNPFYNMDATTEHSGTDRRQSETEESGERGTQTERSASDERSKTSEYGKESATHAYGSDNGETHTYGSDTGETHAYGTDGIVTHTSGKTGEVEHEAGTGTEWQTTDKTVYAKEKRVPDTKETTTFNNEKETIEYNTSTVKSGSGTDTSNGYVLYGKTTTTTPNLTHVSSDTPQGAVGGIMDLESSSYLSFAERNIGNEKVTESGKDKNNEKVTHSSRDTTKKTGKDTTTRTGDHYVTLTGTDDTEKGQKDIGTVHTEESHDASKTSNRTEDSATTEDRTDDHTTTEGRTDDHTTTEDRTKDHTTDVTETGKDGESEKGSSAEQGTETEKTHGDVSEKEWGADEYVNHVVGKNTSEAFGAMLHDYANYFVNLDMEVINSLSDLFMGIW